MDAFTYLVAGSTTEALAWGKGPHAIYMAGGTDLLVKMKTGRIQPSALVDLKKVPGLNGIAIHGSQVEIGALTTIREIETFPILVKQMNILSSSASKLGSVQVRNRATLGGNLCNASPSAETAPALLCLEAQIEIIGSGGVRTVPIDKFFTGPGKTVLQEAEILTKISVPIPPITTQGIYYKLSMRKAMDIAFVGVAVLLNVVVGRIVNARIGLGAVGPIPMRAREAEALLIGNALSQELVAEAAKLAAKASRPIDDNRASAEYRRQMVQALTKEGLLKVYSGIMRNGGMQSD